VRVFIVLDGLDASGKSTQAERLAAALRRRGETVHLRFHPSGDGWAGRGARRVLLSEGRGAHVASALLYIVDVLRSVVLCPWRRSDHVVFVRYLMGTAYLPRPLDRISYLFFYAVLPRPRHYLFLDVEPEEAHRRIREGRESREMFESLEQLRKIGGRARTLAGVAGWTIVDANGPEDEVEKQILSIFKFKW
jgi:dTMP kinase